MKMSSRAWDGHNAMVRRIKGELASLMLIPQRIAACDEQSKAVMAMVEHLQLAVGRVEARQQQGVRGNSCLQEREFQVYSQWGEDGIIHWLTNNVGVSRPVFVEFGVEDYREANTRFLLQQRNWSGLIIDCDPKNIETIKTSDLYWRYNVKAVSAFLTRENINQILLENGVSGEIGLLSIDVDGNDYWIWDAITCVSPAIVVCEYNSLFGVRRPITVPYSSSFDRRRAHTSGLYYGASLPALHQLALRKDYILVGSNSAGNNAFFVRRDLAGGMSGCSPKEVYVPAQYREGRSTSGEFTFANSDERLAAVAEMPVLDVLLGSTVALKDAVDSAYSGGGGLR